MTFDGPVYAMTKNAPKKYKQKYFDGPGVKFALSLKCSKHHFLVH